MIDIGNDSLVAALCESVGAPLTARPLWVDAWTTALGDAAQPWTVVARGAGDIEAAAMLVVRRGADGVTLLSSPRMGFDDAFAFPARSARAAAAIADAIAQRMERRARPWRLDLQQLPPHDLVADMLLDRLPGARSLDGRAVPRVAIALCGLAAAIAWGVADFFGARAAKAQDPSEAAAAVQLVGACAYAVAYAGFGDLSPSLDAIGVIFAAGGGIFFALGLIAFFKGLDAGPVSVVSPIGSAYPLVTTLVVILLFGAQPTGVQLAGIALVVVGIVVCSGIADAARSEMRLTRGVRLGAATLLVWGIAFALIDQGVDRLGWETATLAQLLASAATCWVVLRLRRRRLDHGPLLRNWHVPVAGVLIVTGNLVLNVALSGHADAGPVIATAISACYPVLTVLLALRHLGEKVKAIPLVGAAVAIAGVLALSAGG